MAFSSSIPEKPSHTPDISPNQRPFIQDPELRLKAAVSLLCAQGVETEVSVEGWIMADIERYVVAKIVQSVSKMVERGVLEMLKLPQNRMAREGLQHLKRIYPGSNLRRGVYLHILKVP